MIIKLKKIHFIGIGGSGMSGLALIYHYLGYIVTGSDINEKTNRVASINKNIN